MYKKGKKQEKIRPSAEIIEAKRKAINAAKLQKKMDNSVKMNLINDDDITNIQSAYQMIRKQTGLVYDTSMAEHECLWDENYPESPKRLTSILQRCNELNLINRCKIIEPRFATDDELLLKHTPEQIEILKKTEGSSDNIHLEKLSSQFDAIYIHPSTYKLARLAVGSTINLLEAICKGQVQNGMAIIRPPGHHAMKSKYCGYCFYNNVAIAAEKMLNDNLANKILIVDWDVHHGQATQQMFYNDPRVVYFSIHRYQNGEFWPNLRESDFHYIGESDGIGHNFNIPLNETGMTNADYLAIFQQVLLPMAYEYQPDLVIVSAGYDAALGCPEGEMDVTPAFYSHLLWQLLALANGKVAVILEGGYCIESLSESVALTLRGLLGDPCPMIRNFSLPSLSIKKTILNVIYAQKSHWNCYQYQESFSLHSNSNERNKNLEYYTPEIIFNGDEEELSIFPTRNCYPIQSAQVLNEIHNQLYLLKLTTNLNTANNKVSIVFDDRMLKHCNIKDSTHPETPDRIKKIYHIHEKYDLLKRCNVLKGREATLEELLLVHTDEHIKMIKETESKSNSELDIQSNNYNSIYLNNESFLSASVSVGSLLQLVDDVLNGDSQSGVGIIRPPGHHADSDMPCGFCLFNNIAIAAEYSIQYHGLKRILIVDWDIHHGNGTQSIFLNNPNVLYISLHRYDNGSFFPNSKDANYDVTGVDKGQGFNVNIPWNRRKMGDAEYIAAFQQIVMPIAYQFNPELVLISAGFDACVGDRLGGYNVSPVAYGHFTHWLSALANGKIILALEGGYNTTSISHAMAMCTKALLGDPLPSLNTFNTPCTSAITTINKVIETQKEFWPNLMFQVALPKEIILAQSLTFVNKNKLNQEMMLISPNVESKIVNEEWLTEKNDNLKTKNTTVDFNIEIRAGSSKQSDDDIITNDKLSIETMFAIVPLNDCPHLEIIGQIPNNEIDIKLPCKNCNSTDENWICLYCYEIHCARSINQHAIMHFEVSGHPLTLSFTDLSVWCYACEAYIDNMILYDVRNLVHYAKFQEKLPWTYS